MVKSNYSPLILRDYQKEAVQSILNSWGTVKRVCVQSPTGSGKSLIIAALIRDFVCRNEPVLLIAHKIELICQLRDHVKQWTGLDVGIIANKSVFPPNPEALVQVASIQALSRKRTVNFPPASLVVIDEAHHSSAKSYARVFAHYQGAYVLGVTATPARLDGKGLRFLHNGIGGFEVLVKGKPVRNLIERGYLSDYRVFQSKTILDPKSAGIHSRCGDYVQNELESLAVNNLDEEEIVDTYLEVAETKRTIVYPVSVALSQSYADAFNRRGIPAAHLDSKTNHKTREKIIADFRSGKILILCQHSIVIEGLDLPSIECVIIARPTKSLTFWFQSIGRALRPAPNKEYATIIDCTTNVFELPWIDHEIDWSLDAVSLKTKSEGCFQCKKCRHIWRLNPAEIEQSWTMCPSCRKVYQLNLNPEKDGKSKHSSNIVEGFEYDIPEGIVTLEDITDYIKQKRLQEKLEEEQRELERIQRELQKQKEEEERRLARQKEWEERRLARQKEIEEQKRLEEAEIEARLRAFFEKVRGKQEDSQPSQLPISLQPPEDVEEKINWFNMGLSLMNEWNLDELESWQEDFILIHNTELLSDYGKSDKLNGFLKVDALVRIQKIKGYKPGWIQYQLSYLKYLQERDFIYAAQKLGYKKGWAKYKWLEYNDKD